jgi:hypothetical protein
MGALMMASVHSDTVTNYFGREEGKNAWTTKYGHMLAVNSYILVN